MRFVFDTNVLISAALFEGSVPSQALRYALEVGDVLWSLPSLQELSMVLSRPKFERYVTKVEREQFLLSFARRGVLVEITETVEACRDPKDDMFLELAISGQATCIVSGDMDLRVLHPFRGIDILSPPEFLTVYRK
ncbi:MAG: putative toxin-antitoxin system toxin component, PIN family [Anaerolineales bacterium]|nr:putative toxin-antitoxin system toxin component, PIN family [Anaerolineales bacterium]